jgi:hypothetical protein
MLINISLNVPEIFSFFPNRNKKHASIDQGPAPESSRFISQSFTPQGDLQDWDFTSTPVTSLPQGSPATPAAGAQQSPD